MPPHPPTNFGIQSYYENESEFNGIYSRNSLPKKRMEGTHQIVLYVNDNNVTYFVSCGIKRIPKEI